MKLIKPSFEILEQDPSLEGIYKQIEFTGRTCYRSYDKITEDSAKKFVDMLIARGHTAMLEHGTVYLTIPEEYIRKNNNTHIVLVENITKYMLNSYSKVNLKDRKAYITSNYRVLLENDWLDDLVYLCEPAEHHEKRVTIKFVTSIGIGRELLRHRIFSFANESTRYVDYSKNRHGGEITFIHNNDNINIGQQDIYSRIESCYKGLISLGMKLEFARDVLPLSTKSELVMTGFISDWEKVFAQRVDGTTGNPHPDIKALIEPVKEEFIKRNYV